MVGVAVAYTFLIIFASKGNCDTQRTLEYVTPQLCKTKKLKILHTRIKGKSE